MSNLTYGQLVSKEFDHVDLFDDFTAETGQWRIRATERELFTIENETYTLRRSEPTFFSVSMPLDYEEYTAFSVSAKIRIEESRDNEQPSGGLIFMGQRAGIGAYAFEMTSGNKFRFMILQNGAMRPLFPNEDNGWVYSRDIKKGKGNLVQIKAASGSFDLYINGQYQQSFINETYTSGAIGFYVNANSTMKVDFIKITVERSTVLAENPEEIEPEEVEDETYAQVIKIFRTKMDEQQKEISRLERELSICKSSLNIDTTARRQNNELRRENRELLDRVQKLEANLTKAKTRLEYLESMKKDVENNQNGDVILGLTDLLAQERKKNKELTQRVAELEQEIRSQKN